MNNMQEMAFKCIKSDIKNIARALDRLYCMDDLEDMQECARLGAIAMGLLHENFIILNASLREETVSNTIELVVNNK